MRSDSDLFRWMPLSLMLKVGWPIINEAERVTFISYPFFFFIKWSVLLFRTPGYQDSLMAFPSLAPQIMIRLITSWPLPVMRFLVCHIYLSFEADGPNRQTAQCKKRMKNNNTGHVCVSTVIKKLWLTVSVSKSILFRDSVIHFTSSFRP